VIAAYFSQIEELLNNQINIREIGLRKKFYNHTQGYISGTITFINNYRLDFMELKNTGNNAKLKYRYQYMDEKNSMVFRYDNAPHHRDIITFPHHKHDGSQIMASPEPELAEVLSEILSLQNQSL